MDPRAAPATVGLLLMMLVAGPAVAEEASPGAAAGTATKPVNVQLKDSAFKPQVVMVQVNQSITWTNKDSFAHDVTSTNGSFNSTGGDAGMKGGDTFSLTAAAAGVFDYYCTVHSSGRGNGMWGRVVVVEAPLLTLGGGGAAATNPEEIGVQWLAHWVGIVSFVAVIATLLVYYFVLKYGESIHTTDHRDRKEK